MNLKRFLSPVLLLSLILCVNASATADDFDHTQHIYNLAVLSTGIVCHYNLYGDWPDSIETIYSEGFIPENLFNPVTGEQITGNSVTMADGTYSVNRTGPDDIELVAHGQSYPRVHPFGLDDKQKNSTGVSEEDVNLLKLFHWSYACVPAAHIYLGELPQSVDDIKATGFWPYTDTTNYYTGEPVKFDSREPGDMDWIFSGDKIDIRFSGMAAGEVEWTGYAWYYPPDYTY